MEDEEDCGCGFEEKPELVCQLELEDAMKFHTELGKKHGQIETLKKIAKRSKSQQKKKELALQALHIEREIKDLESAKQLAFQRFAKCENQNPQVQMLNEDHAMQKLNNTWDMILNSSDELFNNNQTNKKRTAKKKQRKR